MDIVATIVGEGLDARAAITCTTERNQVKCHGAFPSDLYDTEDGKKVTFTIEHWIAETDAPFPYIVSSRSGLSIDNGLVLPWAALPENLRVFVKDFMETA